MYNKEAMKNRKIGYLEFALLASSMSAYEYNEGDEKDNLETIKSYCEEIVDDILLPSNRMGTPLAVALETHSFKSALYLIENAERFGLAQLHQLRGRVGRGEYQSYCILKFEGRGKVVQERMKIMCQTNDGFIISEKDLELRGSGDFFGTAQHRNSRNENSKFI